MKTKILFLTLVFFVSLPSFVLAEEGHDSHDHNETQNVADTTFQGKIIGLTCYLQHDSIGEKHKSCARECAQKGLPLGFMTDDGKLYQIMGEGHDDLVKINSRLLDYIEEHVLVVGKVFIKNELKAIIIEKIKKG